MGPDRRRRIEELYFAAVAAGAGGARRVPERRLSRRRQPPPSRSNRFSRTRKPSERFLEPSPSDQPAVGRACLAVVAYRTPDWRLPDYRAARGWRDGRGLLAPSIRGLGREVAIEALPTALASNPNRLRLLEQEARLLATLNHPHIASIYGFEEAGGMRGIVLELVEGRTRWPIDWPETTATPG